ncbi:MAG TPA: hypothetical protein VH437_02030 [Terriglobales bacterium]
MSQVLAIHSAASMAVQGELRDSVFHSQDFGFSYKIPYGWVDRTQSMQEGTQPGKSMVLLSGFERPPEAEEAGVNSAVVIAAEAINSYPGLKTATDYFGPLTELTTGKGFKVVEEPYPFDIGSKQLIRSDFSKESGGHTMYQATLVTLAKRYAVSFTFLGETKDEVDSLIERLTFGTTGNTGVHSK